MVNLFNMLFSDMARPIQVKWTAPVEAGTQPQIKMLNGSVVNYAHYQCDRQWLCGIGCAVTQRNLRLMRVQDEFLREYFSTTASGKRVPSPGKICPGIVVVCKNAASVDVVHSILSELDRKTPEFAVRLYGTTHPERKCSTLQRFNSTQQRRLTDNITVEVPNIFFLCTTLDEVQGYRFPGSPTIVNFNLANSHLAELPDGLILVNQMAMACCGDRGQYHVIFDTEDEADQYFALALGNMRDQYGCMLKYQALQVVRNMSRKLKERLNTQ
jgi:hypothetical protein